MGKQPPLRLFDAVLTAIQIMDGPVTDIERDRFIWHAQHIRIFHLHCARRIDPAVFLRLSLSRLGAPLTPRLHTLRVHSGWPPYKDMAAQLLSGPALRTLAVTFACAEATTWVTTDSKPPLDRHSYALRMLLADVAAAAPRLVSLQVCGGAHASLIAPIGTMHALRKLDLSLMVRPFGTDLLRALAGLEELEELALPNKFDAREAVPCRGFKNVRSLTVLRGAQTVPSLLAAMPDMRLREFSLANVESEDIDLIQAVADALSAGPGVHLEVLSLPAILTDWPPILNQPLSTLLAPFFALKRIKSLHLDCKQPLPTMDEDLRMIGRAWPELEHIHLAYTNFVPDIVAPTINGMVELAYSCPGLKDVCFFADRSVLDPWFTVPLNGLNGPPWIPDEQIRDVGQVARLLYSTFGLRKNKGIDRARKWDAVLHEMAKLHQGLEDCDA